MPSPVFLHGKETELLLNQYDITCYINSIDLTQDIDLPETTTFCDDTRRYINGLRNATGSIGGFIDDDADAGIDAILQATFNTITSSIWTDFPQDGTIGNIAYLFRALISSYNTTQPTDGVQAFTADLQLDGNLYRGFSLHAIASETASTMSTGVDLINSSGYAGATTSATGAVAHLHVTAASGTTPTLDVDIEDSPDDMTYTLITGFSFTQVTTAASYERIESTLGTAPTVDQYVRCSTTIAGTSPSYTFALAYAPKPL